MSEKELPLVSPPILLYVDYAYTLSILRNYSKTDAWFYSNYIQIFYQKKGEGDICKYFITDTYGRVWNPYIPWFNYQSLDRSLVKSLNINIMDLVINSLNTNNYVHLYWDEYYVPNGITYNKDHFSHATLIYGYNLTEKCFYTVGFQDTRKTENLGSSFYSYDKHKISFNDFEQAYYSDANYVGTEISLMKLNDEFTYNFDLTVLLQQLNDFYLSRNPLLNYGTHFNANNIYNNSYFRNPPGSEMIFGMEAYKSLQSFIETAPQDNYKRSFQPIYALWEHKKIMLERIEYLQNNKYLSEKHSLNVSYKQIEKKAKALNDYFIKFIISKNDKLITRMVKILSEIDEHEKIVLADMIKELSKQVM